MFCFMTQFVSIGRTTLNISANLYRQSWQKDWIPLQISASVVQQCSDRNLWLAYLTQPRMHPGCHPGNRPCAGSESYAYGLRPPQPGVAGISESHSCHHDTNRYNIIRTRKLIIIFYNILLKQIDTLPTFRSLNIYKDNVKIKRCW